MGHAPIPVPGYAGGMDSKAIGAALKAAREAAKLSQDDVGDQVNVGQSTIQRIEDGKFKKLTETILAVGEMLNVVVPTPRLKGVGFKIVDEKGRVLAPRNSLLPSEMDVFHTAEGGEGAVIINGEPTEKVQRPPVLLGVRGAYGVHVSGTSMIPAFRPGDIALVHPYMEPKHEDDVILQDAESRNGMIKTFMRSTKAEWWLRQWNPAKEFSRSKKEWPTCHVVVGKYSRR